MPASRAQRRILARGVRVREVRPGRPRLQEVSAQRDSDPRGSDRRLIGRVRRLSTHLFVYALISLDSESAAGSMGALTVSLYTRGHSPVIRQFQNH